MLQFLLLFWIKSKSLLVQSSHIIIFAVNYSKSPPSTGCVYGTLCVYGTKIWEIWCFVEQNPIKIFNYLYFLQSKWTFAVIKRSLLICASPFCTLHVQQERNKNTVIKMDETGKSPNQEFTMYPVHSPTLQQINKTFLKSDYLHMASSIHCYSVKIQYDHVQ